MGQPKKLLEFLKDFAVKIEEDKVPASNFKNIETTIKDPEFNKERLSIISNCAGGLCDWIANIYLYHSVVVEVEPKRRAVAEAEV